MPQTILITGATAGIGRHLALHFARAGHVVIATGRRAAALSELRTAAPTLHGVELDVTSAASIERARAEVDRLTDGRGLDVLINNAGYGQTGPLEELSDAELRAQFDTNVFGLMAVTRAFLPGMRARGRGRVVNVSSIGGRVTMPLMGAYTASKYAVEALSDALRMELRPAGIAVVLIEPGPIRSEFADRAWDGIAAHASAESPYAAAYARAGWFKRLSERSMVGPEKVARVVEHALGARRPRARYVVPFSSRLMLALLLVLPTPLVDAAMRWMTGLRRPALPPPDARDQRALPSA